MTFTDQLAVVEAPLYPPTLTPPAQPLPLGRFLASFVRNPLRTLPQQAYMQPLTLHRFRGGRTIAWVSDPTLIERILLYEQEDFPKTPLERRVFEPAIGHGILTAEGAEWRWQRRTVAPLFQHQKLLNHIPAMVSAAHALIDRWRRHPPGSLQSIDRDMTDATYEVITHTVLSGGTAAEASAIKDAADRLLATTSWEAAYSLVGLPVWVWHPGKARARRSAAELRRVVGNILERHRAESSTEDLLGVLLAAREPESGLPMSDDQLVDNLVTFLLAGHETTAKALTWTLYLLARAPAWQNAIRAEIAAVCGAEPVSAAHIDQLVTTRKVLKEALRLYPPVALMSRLTGRELELSRNRIGEGTVITIPIYAIHRHRKLWAEPDRFDPERFAPEREAHHMRAQFMPFGFGPRTCIGISFAMLEATVLLGTLLRAASFTWDGRHLPEPVTRTTLRPKGGMPLAVTVLS
jgi:cytochrome P450